METSVIWDAMTLQKLVSQYLLNLEVIIIFSSMANARCAKFRKLNPVYYSEEC